MLSWSASLLLFTFRVTGLPRPLNIRSKSKQITEASGIPLSFPSLLVTLDRERIKNTSCQKENFLILQLISCHCKETDSEWKG